LLRIFLGIWVKGGGLETAATQVRRYVNKGEASVGRGAEVARLVAGLGGKRGCGTSGTELWAPINHRERDQRTGGVCGDTQGISASGAVHPPWLTTVRPPVQGIHSGAVDMSRHTNLEIAPQGQAEGIQRQDACASDIRGVTTACEGKGSIDGRKIARNKKKERVTKFDVRGTAVTD